MYKLQGLGRVLSLAYQPLAGSAGLLHLYADLSRNRLPTLADGKATADLSFELLALMKSCLLHLIHWQALLMS